MSSALKAVEDVEAGSCLPVTFVGHRMLIDPAGVAVLPDLSTLLVSDLHLEKGSSFARRRQFVPPYDTMETLSRLALLAEKYQPQLIITLGDNFHDDHASSRLSEDAVSLIWAIAEKRELIWITGNHDPSPPDNVPGSCVEEIAIGGITLRHIADPSCAVPEMSGHLHPAAKIRVRGKSVRKPCFITDGTRMIIPSFGVYTGGLNVCDQAFHGLFKTQSMCAYMLGTDRVFPIHGHQLVV